MTDLLFGGDVSAFLSDIAGRAAIVMMAWLLTAAACLVDMWSGVSTSRYLKQPINSHGLRKTVSKILEYFKLELISCFFDILGSLFNWYELPYATVLVAVGALLIEGMSVVENARCKRANAGKVPELIKEIVECSTSEQGQQILKKVGALVNTVSKSTKWEQTGKNADVNNTDSHGEEKL